MLRDPVQAALNEILVACEAAETEHARAADLLGDAPEAEQFRAIARRRAAAAALFREEVLRRGDLPREPNQEREILREGLTQLKTAFAQDRLRVLAGDQALIEDGVAEACRGAPAELDPAARAQVDALRADAETTARMLRELAGNPEA